MGSSGGEECSSTEQFFDGGPSATPQQPRAFIGPRETTARLPAEWAQRYDELQQMVQAAKTRSLTLAEHQAVVTLIKSLRALLEPDS
jgi:hypothetical protein